MDSNETIMQKIREQGLLPLFYHPNKQVCLDISNALYDAGIRVVEFTNRGESAPENFRALVSDRDQTKKDLLLAVGTIRSASQAAQFMDAGADLLISPVFDEEVCDAAYIHKKLWIPGCMTPTEIHVAENAGCRLVKIFPGNVLGPSFISGIRELFQQMDFMPTGGVEPEKENLKEWFDAGVCAVGMGSKLISKKMVKEKDFGELIKKTRQVLKIIQSIKGKDD